MGKRRVYAVPVTKPVTVALLLLTTGAMAGLLYMLSGKAYAADTHPLHDMLGRLFGAEGESVTRATFLAFLMPVIANILLFVPWGFLSFIALDTSRRPRRTTYAMTLLGALLFAAAMYTWQRYLPTRVTSMSDIVTNGMGALAGAALGHARKSVHVRFEV